MRYCVAAFVHRCARDDSVSMSIETEAVRLPRTVFSIHAGAPRAHGALSERLRRGGTGPRDPITRRAQN